MHKMAKKNAVAYKPLNSIQDATPIIEQKVLQIPNYEDSGVQFQGKYKTQVSLDKYELKAQVPKYYFKSTTGAETGFITRDNASTSVFFIKQIIISYYYALNTTAQEFNIYNDYQGAGGINPQFQITLPRKAGVGDLIVINLEVPIKISSNVIGYDAGSSAGVNDWLNFTLLGWEEQK